jgi:predicted PurR-regulated permease PerM
MEVEPPPSTPEDRRDLADPVDPTEPVPPPRVALRHYLWIASAALVVFLALRWLGPVLTPFLIGTIFAYLGRPLVAIAERRGMPRLAATIVVILLFGLAVAGLFFVLIPLIRGEVVLAAQRLPDLAMQFTARISPWVEERFGIHLAFDLDTIREFVTENAQSAQQLSARVIAGVTRGGRIILSLLINAALVPVVMFYLLRDWNMIVARLDDLTPRRWQAKTRTIAREIDTVLAEFLHGQLLVMLVLAAYYAIALWIAGLDRAFAIGILTGLLVFIPYVGFGTGLVLGVVAALLQWHGWPGFIAVLVVYGVGQLLENYVLIPFLVGDRIGLHPLAVIFALLAFGQLFGFAGVLLALPMAASLLVGLRHLRAAYQTSPVYRDG